MTNNNNDDSSISQTNKKTVTMASRLKKEPIKVFLRARPLNKFEETSGCSAAVKFIEKTRVSIRDHCAGDFQSELDSVSD